MSYLEHFKLTEQPFRLTPDPEFVYWSEQHSRAKAYLESTIWLADGFVVITGDIGSGKTTLLHSFLSELEDDVVYAMVSQTQLTASQFLQAVLVEFGFEPFSQRKVELLDMLNTFLIDQYSQGKKVLLIVDEAQNLTRKVLEEIRLLSGIETHKEKVLRIVLAGQPELRDTLENKQLQQLVQRVRLRFHLGPLNKREMGEYIEHRLEVAGRSSHDLFARNTFDLIHRYTGGVPRLVNTLCDTALLCAYVEKKDVMEVEEIQTAVEELGWTERAFISERPSIPRIVPGPSRDARCHIAVRTRDQMLSEHVLRNGRVVIGRLPDNEIYIKSRFVSRHHAQIVCDDDGCIIEDLNSTNGVFVRDERVQRYTLNDGDVVSLGVHDLVFTDLRPAQVNDEDSAIRDSTTG